MDASARIEDQGDAVLAAQAQAGDRRAFGALVDRHYDLIFRSAWRWIGDQDDAQDVAQEVCIRLAKAIGSWRGDAALSTFLYALTLNAVRDFQRKRGRERRLAGALQMQALVDVQAEAADCDPAQELWTAVRTLPDKQRDAVLLVHGEGVSHAQAAQALGCSENTVSWHIHEARKALKKLLKSEAGAGMVQT